MLFPCPETLSARNALFNYLVNAPNMLHNLLGVAANIEGELPGQKCGKEIRLNNDQ